MTKLIAIVPAGGVGQRAIASDSPFEVPKQYQPIAGVPMIHRAVKALRADARIDHVVVAIQDDDRWAQAVLAKMIDQGADHCATPANVHTAPVHLLRCAGATRAQTVLGALNRLEAQETYPASDPPEAADPPTPWDDVWVLVHDAARPGLPAHCLTALIDQCLTHEVGGLLALPAADTLKRAHPHPPAGLFNVAGTLDRDLIWMAQTPQMFKASMLKQALIGALAAGFEVTDEASAMEWAGYAPLLVRGSVRNAKVTWPEDFQWVGSWLNT